jgi:hypothetical protein
VNRRNSFNHREFLSTALGAAASFSVLPPGPGFISGANKGKSYFFFSVDPGDHQVCTIGQGLLFANPGL